MYILHSYLAWLIHFNAGIKVFWYTKYIKARVSTYHHPLILPININRGKDIDEG